MVRPITNEVEFEDMYNIGADVIHSEWFKLSICGYYNGVTHFPLTRSASEILILFHIQSNDEYMMNTPRRVQV